MKQKDIASARELLEVSGYTITAPQADDAWRRALNTFYMAMGGRPNGGGEAQTPFDVQDRRTLKALRAAFRDAREIINDA